MTQLFFTESNLFIVSLNYFHKFVFYPSLYLKYIKKKINLKNKYMISKIKLYFKK